VQLLQQLDLDYLKLPEIREIMRNLCKNSDCFRITKIITIMLRVVIALTERVGSRQHLEVLEKNANRLLEMREIWK